MTKVENANFLISQPLNPSTTQRFSLLTFESWQLSEESCEMTSKFIFKFCTLVALSNKTNSLLAYLLYAKLTKGNAK